MQVQDIMTQDPTCCTPDTDLQAVARMMVEMNCGEIPVVHGRDALWETKRASGGRLPEPPRVSGQGIHLPHPSYWPVVAAIGIAGIMTGVMTSPHLGPWGIIAGGLILFIGVFNWAFEPAG